MGIFTPPPSDSVDFELGPAVIFPASSVPFELGEIDKQAADSGSSADSREHLERNTPKQDWATAVESAFFPQKNFRRTETAGGQGISQLDARLSPQDAGQAADECQETATFDRPDSGSGVLERGTIVEALQVTVDGGEGENQVVWYAFGYLEIQTSDGGTGDDARDGLSGTLEDGDHGRGEEGSFELSADMEADEEGLGDDKGLHVFVKRFGEPWGMTPVQLGAIQED